MKNKVLLVIAMAFFAVIAEGQHKAEFSIFGYYEQADIIRNESDQRLKYGGVGVNLKHSLKDESLKWIGSTINIQWDYENELTGTLAVELRATAFNKFFSFAVILPVLNMDLNRGGNFGKYNSPPGGRLEMFRGKIRIGYRGLVYTNGLVSRISLKYVFKK